MIGHERTLQFSKIGFRKAREKKGILPKVYGKRKRLEAASAIAYYQPHFLNASHNRPINANLDRE